MGIKRFIQSRKLASVKPFEQTGKWRPGENPPQLVGLILYLEDVSEIASLQKVHVYFTEMGAVCRTCIYQKNLRIQIPEELVDKDMLFLNQESVNWYGMVRSGFADSFLGESFDLIINLSKEFYFTTSYLASLSKATLKIGRYEWPSSPYRMVLPTRHPNDDDAFIHLLDSSLQFIRFE